MLHTNFILFGPYKQFKLCSNQTKLYQHVCIQQIMNPDSLYIICLNALIDYIKNRTIPKQNVLVLSNNTLFDLYQKMFLNEQLHLISMEINDLEVLSKLLHVKRRRTELLRLFRVLVDHGYKTDEQIVDSYAKRYEDADDVDLCTIDLGLCIGSFLSDGCCFRNAHLIFNTVEILCRRNKGDEQLLNRLLDCHRRRTYVESMYMFKDARNTFNTETLAEDIK